MFLKGWDVITKREQELTLPILIHYSTIDEVSDYWQPCIALQSNTVTEGLHRTHVNVQVTLSSCMRDGCDTPYVIYCELHTSLDCSAGMQHLTIL